MEHGFLHVTVCFQAPFWVGILEREWDQKLEVCKHTFGAEPTDQEVWRFLLAHWRELDFSAPVEAQRRKEIKNPKRLRRLADAALRRSGPGTKAQQALQLQRESAKLERTRKRHQRDAAEEARKYLLRQEKKRQKHRGH